MEPVRVVTGNPDTVGGIAVPRVARYMDKEFIIGPGLDEVLNENKNLILLDEEFGDLYGDYVFLGYNVFAETIDLLKADIVDMYTTRLLLSKGKSVVVCGKNPIPCTVSLAAFIELEKQVDSNSALREAWSTLRTIYDRESIGVPRQLVAGLNALARATRLLGENVFSTIFSIASSYEYGYGRASYGDLVSWLNNLGASDDAFIAGLLSFLALSLHGAPAEILRYRLDAVGESSLISLIGPRAEAALGILKRFAENKIDSDAGLLQLVVHLGPGTDTTLYVEGNDRVIRVYCSGSEPTKECLTKIQNAERVREAVLKERIDTIKMVIGAPEPVVVES